MKERQKTNLENGLWTYNLATHQYYFAPEICKIFDLEPQDLKSHDALLHKIHADDIDDYAKAFKKGTMSLSPFTLKFRIIANDGTIKDIEENVQFITEGTGTVISYYGIVSDISTLVKLEHQKPAESRTLINSILKTLPNLIFVKNIDEGYRFTFVNENFSSFYGYNSDDIIGKYDKDISTAEQAESCYATDEIASRHNITSPLISIEEIPVTPKSVKYMQTIKFAHVISGTNYLICSAMDITALVKARQKAEESDKLKSAFLHTISHEIRTPMNSIMGYTQLFGDTKDMEEISFFCDKIKDNSEKLLNLLSDIVYLANMETVNEKLEYENIDIESLFAFIKNQYEQQAKEKSLNFIYTQHHTTFYIYSNREKITELLKLFIDNAIKFTHNGCVSIGYSLNDKGIRIWVKDTGIGIDKKDRKNVFKRFVKLDEFTPGTGIGLYIAQKIAKSMKGKIGIDSKMGKGTLVWAYIPLYTKGKTECNK